MRVVGIVSFDRVMEAVTMHRVISKRWTSGTAFAES